MRTLYLLRHAKSSWDDVELPDLERPLAPRGERAAERIAGHVRAARIRPSIVLCSPAARARATLDAIAGALPPSIEVRVDRNVYGATAAELLEMLRDLRPRLRSAMVIGHNPSMQQLALDLTGDGSAKAVRQLKTKLPTGALVTLDLGAARWRDLAPGQAYLESVVLPTDLDANPGRGRRRRDP